MKQDFIPLDNETLTKLIYSHDDEITELTQQILYLIRKMEQIEKIKSSQKVVRTAFWKKQKPHNLA